MQITLVVPVYNEGTNVIETAESIHRTFSKHNIDGQILFVNDGSTDDTAVHLKRANVDVVTHAKNRGYGSALMSGILAAKHDWIVITDADLTYPIEDLPLLLQKSADFDMVVGARQGRFYHGSWLKRVLRLVFKFLVEFATGRIIPDINSGFRIFKKSDVMPIRRVISTGFSFTTTITLLFFLNGKQIEYVPIAYNKRGGKSHVKLVRDGLRSLQYIIEAMLAFNPIKAFLLLGIVYTLPAAVFVLCSWHELLLIWSIFCLISALGFVATAYRLSLILNTDRLKHHDL